jgi:hypothetical protein
MEDLRKHIQQDLNETLRGTEKRTAMNVIEANLKDTFQYLWDEFGMEMTSSEYNSMVGEVLKNFDITKFFPDWGIQK